MPSRIREQFVKASTDLFHDLQRGIEREELDEELRKLYKIISKSDSLRENISIQDLQDTFTSFPILALARGKPLEDISDEEFTGYLESNILTTKKYQFYYPIHDLHGFPKNLKVGHVTTLTYDDLPDDIQEDIVRIWKRQFEMQRGYWRTEEEFVRDRKTTAFIHLAVPANGLFRATEKAFDLAQESVHILRFLYKADFRITEYCLIIEGSGSRGTCGTAHTYGAAPIFLPVRTYRKTHDKEMSELTDIVTKTRPTTIERKIRNAIRIFGIQTSVTNDEVRFVLMVACLESLLLTKSDRDYILWRLAEKTTFLVGKDKRKLNKYIRLAYDKRSAFIHAKPRKKKDEIITEDDVLIMGKVVTSVLYKLLEFRREGYTQIKKGENIRSIDEYIEEIKFGGKKS